VSPTREVARFLGNAIWYPAALAAGTLLLNAQPAARQAAWLDWASTDVNNLRSHPLGCLVASGLLAQENTAIWCGLALVGLGTAAHRLGGRRTAALVVGVHVCATLLSEGVVAARISAGDLPASAGTLMDVGPSYVVLGALVAAIGFGAPRTARLTCAVGLAVLAPFLFEGLFQGDVAALGHLAGIGLGALFGLAASRWPTRIAPRSEPVGRDDPGTPRIVNDYH
jgi:hypothetical protein